MSAPSLISAPHDVAGVSEAMRGARLARRRVTPCGSRSKIAWMAVEEFQPLSLLQLNAPIEHCAGDLTATVPAGVSLRTLNAMLREGGQWLSLDPPQSESATIGGIVATNDSGPRRHRFGAPRDLIIGVEMVLADGRVAKAGGRVVKNVAGYDLGRLLCGSFGSLAVITSVTFKLAPLAEASRTVVATVNGPRAFDEIGRALTASLLTPTAVDIAAAPLRLLIRFETTPIAAAAQAAAAAELCGRLHADVTVVSEMAEEQVWRQALAPVWEVYPANGALLKISVLPTVVPSVLHELYQEPAADAVSCQVSGRALLGVLYVRMNGELDQVSALVTRLRASAEGSGGSAVLLEADEPLRARVTRWGTIGSATRVMRAVKARFDPDGVLPAIPGEPA
jgi:glycolate oxidase FAD binding subunit